MAFSQRSVLLDAPVPSSRINDTFFLDESTGWIASSAGVMYETTNGRTTWTAEGMASGTYYYRLTVAGKAETQKLILVR